MSSIFNSFPPAGIRSSAGESHQEEGWGNAVPDRARQADLPDRLQIGFNNDLPSCSAGARRDRIVFQRQAAPCGVKADVCENIDVSRAAISLHLPNDGGRFDGRVVILRVQALKLTSKGIQSTSARTSRNLLNHNAIAGAN